MVVWFRILRKSVDMCLLHLITECVFIDIKKWL